MNKYKGGADSRRPGSVQRMVRRTAGKHLIEVGEPEADRLVATGEWHIMLSYVKHVPSFVLGRRYSVRPKTKAGTSDGSSPI